mgnify:CR=1 FL=1
MQQQILSCLNRETVPIRHDTTKDAYVKDLAAGKKYALKTATLDFSKVQFTEPGVYRISLQKLVLTRVSQRC